MALISSKNAERMFHWLVRMVTLDQQIESAVN